MKAEAGSRVATPRAFMKVLQESHDLTFSENVYEYIANLAVNSVPPETKRLGIRLHYGMDSRASGAFAAGLPLTLAVTSSPTNLANGTMFWPTLASSKAAM